MIQSPFHWQIGFPDFMAYSLGMGLLRTNIVFDKYYLCIFCASSVINNRNNRYLKREGRLVNNKLKDELLYPSLRSGTNSKLNKFWDIQGE
jgi:hypothetical protein